MAITVETRLVRTADIHQAQLGPEQIALLSSPRGEYYGVEGPAALIWQLLETEMPLGTICDQIMQEYDVEESACVSDTIAFVAELVAEDLVRIVD